MSVSRRSVLKAGALGAGVLPWPLACQSERASQSRTSTFQHGVASGDPWPDSVILWTRLSVPEPSLVVSGGWQVFASADRERLVSSGDFETDAERDFTVKVEATGLEPATTYYFEFTSDGETSVMGRTRTAPATTSERLRFCIMSCASLAHGYFNAYRSVATRPDIDAVIHLGDYIYEYGNDAYGSLRDYDPPHELFTLEDYRRRYAHYRSDPDLQEAHRQLPFLVVWDDHEVANNAWKDGAPEHTPDSPVPYAQRKAAAQQAFFEWLPVRETMPGRVHRAFRFGDLVHLVLADTRHWGRDPLLEVSDPALDDAARTILGSDQEAWLAEEFANAQARWLILGQQVVFSELDIGVTNIDAWDGYTANRERVLELIEQQELDNVVILTGDIHMSWAFDVVRQAQGATYDPKTGEGSVAVELVTPAITSPGFDEATGERVAQAALTLPEVRLAQLWRRGYLLLDIDHERLQGEWYLFDRIDQQSDAEFYRALQVRAGERHLREADGPATSSPTAPALAPATRHSGTSQ